VGKDIFKIVEVVPGSIAEEIGIEVGDYLLSINNENFNDVFDYRFLITNEEILLEIQKKNDEIWELEVEKDEYEDLGLEFETSMMDQAKSCTNKCVFCFIDQLPKGMRQTLYFKDDDSRLSFLTGNYVTLTNMNDNDINRIIKYKMSPINVSVHTTNQDLRVFMLKNKNAGGLLKNLKKLCNAGISVNCQIVLCVDINDGAELDKTISDLIELKINSISIVPVGITKYRENLVTLKPFTSEHSKKVIMQIEEWQRGILREYNSRLVYPADEFFISAGISIPDYSYYEDFPQIENGVGLIAMFLHEFEECRTSLPGSAAKRSLTAVRTISIATGVSAFIYIKGVAEKLEKVYNVKVKVYAIKNHFFGETVTVTGLLTGQDIVSQLGGKDLGDELLICRAMLKSGESLFLDDYSTDLLEKKLKVKITVVENSGKDFIEKVIGMDIGE
jgi:putative radical SAM enzyme (TIGR03279 family)